MAIATNLHTLVDEYAARLETLNLTGVEHDKPDSYDSAA